MSVQKNKTILVKKNRVITGLHILGEIHTADRQSLKDHQRIKKRISQIIQEQSLKELGSFYYQFPQGGFTGVVCLSESHIALHAWPEFGYLTLDVYLCNYSKDNSQKTKIVFEQISALFHPSRIIKHSLKR